MFKSDLMKDKNIVNKKDPQADKIEQLEDKIRELALTIDKVEDEKLEITNKLMKALADYQNLERGVDSRVEARLAHVKREVAARLIEIIDDIKFGSDASKALTMSPEVKAWLEGVTGTLGKMEKAIGELGIRLIEVKVGEQFNSTNHEAIGVIEGGESNQIAEVIQPGYMMGESVVRPARVMVYKSNNAS